MFILPLIYPLQALAFALILELNEVVRTFKEKKPPGLWSALRLFSGSILSVMLLAAPLYGGYGRDARDVAADFIQHTCQAEHSLKGH